jgi:hypothetical protein
MYGTYNPIFDDSEVGIGVVRPDLSSQMNLDIEV